MLRFVVASAADHRLSRPLRRAVEPNNLRTIHVVTDYTVRLAYTFRRPSPGNDRKTMVWPVDLYFGAER